MTFVHMHDGETVYYETECEVCEVLEAEGKPIIPQANIGCATTGQILDELRARIELDGRIDYRTIDHD